MGVASEEPAADTAGDTGDDWLGEEPDVQASETQDFDVVIIGAGLSGVCAARAAAEEGAKVAIVEKSSSFNCRSGEYALLNGSLNKRWGRENIVDEDVVVDRLMRECTYRNKRSILKKWASHAHEVMDWFIEAYPELTICDSTREAVTQEQFDKGILVPLAWPQPEHYDYRNEEFPTFPSSMEFRSSRKDQQGFIVEANLNKAVENGAQTFFGCFGTKLLKDSDGRVTGVIIRDAQNDNKYIQLNASKGVILATGDNSGDEKIMKHFAPEIVEKKIANMGAMGMLGVDVEGKTVETGDGLRMGAWIGAKVQDFHAPMTHHMGSGMGVTPFLQINKRGDRFMNECIPGQQLENQIELQPECTSFQLYDSKWGEEVPYMPANHGGLCYIIPEDEDESNPNYTDRQYTKISAKAEAYQFKADTLEDLLTQCGFEAMHWIMHWLPSSATTSWPRPVPTMTSASPQAGCSRWRIPRTMHASGAPLPCWCAWAAWRATRTATPSPRRTPPAPSATSSRACMSAAMCRAAATQWNTPSACAASATACASTTATSPARTAWPVSDTLLTEH